MPLYTCSYAIDTPSYFDFTIEAKNKQEALAKIKAALAEGKFDNVPCTMSHEDERNARVFIQGKAGEHDPDLLEDQLEAMKPDQG